jgi:hypothetical protein
MRAPSSFRDELIKYRKQLVADPDPLALAIIDRWRDHPDTDKMWSVIHKHCPDIEPTLLINSVLSRRFKAPLLQYIVDELPTVERKINERARHHRRAGDYQAIGVENVLLGRAIELRRKLLNRKRSEAPRTWFVTEWSADFKKICGLYLDEAVAFLTDIAFDDGTDAEAVRNIRR